MSEASDSARQAAREGAMQTLGVIDDRFLDLYAEAADDLLVLAAHMISGGVQLGPTFAALHSLVVDVEMEIIGKISESTDVQ